jgi:hypothetical protein
MDEGLGVATEAIGLAGEAIKAHEGLLVIFRSDRFFDFVSLLETAGKIESEGDAEEFLCRQDAFWSSRISADTEARMKRPRRLKIKIAAECTSAVGA